MKKNKVQRDIIWREMAALYNWLRKNWIFWVGAIVIVIGMILWFSVKNTHYKNREEANFVQYLALKQDLEHDTTPDKVQKVHQFIQKNAPSYHAYNLLFEWAQQINKNKALKYQDFPAKESSEWFHHNSKMRASVLLLDASIFEIRNDFASAIAKYESFLVECPTDHRGMFAQLQVARCYWESGKPEKAQIIYKSIIEQNHDEDSVLKAKQFLAVLQASQKTTSPEIA